MQYPPTVVEHDSAFLDALSLRVHQPIQAGILQSVRIVSVVLEQHCFSMDGWYYAVD